jgi:polar amino acid transport system substrate-binding protein
LKAFLALIFILIAPNCRAETLRVGFPSTVPPYVFDKELRGLDYDLVVSAAKYAGLDIKPIFAPRERLFHLLEASDVDAISSVNPDLQIRAAFSDVYIEYHNWAVALTSRKLEINSVADLKGYSIVAFQRARFAFGKEFQEMARSNPLYREEAQQIARNTLIYSGKADVAITDRRIFEYFNHELANKVDTSQPVTWYPLFPPTQYRVAFLRNDIRDRFNAGLAALRASGEYEAIVRRYD